MYVFYLLFEWFSRHYAWTALGAFVMVGTVAITLYFDRKRPRF